MAEKRNPLVVNPISIRILALFGITAMMVFTSSFHVIANKWDGNGSTELLAGLLPNNSPHKFAIDLPVDQYVTYLPLIQNGYLPNNTVQNGGFEEGNLAWVEYSKIGYYLIVDETLSPVQPQSGSWLAWLGGDNDEVSILSQEIYIPHGRSILNFWYATFSEDVSGGDYFYVYIGEFFAGGENISSYYATNGWVHQVRDLSVLAGTFQTISFVVKTDYEFNTNVFLDNISLETTDTLPKLATIEPVYSTEYFQKIGSFRKLMLQD